MLKDLSYTSNESLFYTYLLNENGFNSINDSISGTNVVKLFLKSKLDKFTLKKVWDLASERKAPDLNKLEFFCACRLVALIQSGQELTMDNAVKLNYKDVMPKFEGVYYILGINKIIIIQNRILIICLIILIINKIIITIIIAIIFQCQIIL